MRPAPMLAALAAMVIIDIIMTPAGAPARAQDQDAEGAFAAARDALFDRFATVEGERLERLVALLAKRLEQLAKLPPAEQTAKAAVIADARLELARTRLARGEHAAADLEAGRAAEAGGEAATRVHALRVLVAYLGGIARIEQAPEKDQKEKLAHELDGAMKAAKKKLTDAAGSGEAAGTLMQDEQSRLDVLKNLNDLGRPPRAIGLPDLDGKPIDLAAYAGKVVLVDFWATWCAPCMAELPNVVKLYRELHGRGLEIVGISLDQKKDALDRVIADDGIAWRQHFDGKGWQNAVATAWDVKSVPRTYLIDHEGKVRYVNARGEGLAAAALQLVERAEAARKKRAP